MVGREDSDGGAERQSSSRSSDTLDYLCALIGELRQIADRSGQQTLSAILAAALTEARIQKDHRRR
jgi:hypothetical protein